MVLVKSERASKHMVLPSHAALLSINFQRAMLPFARAHLTAVCLMGRTQRMFIETRSILGASLFSSLFTAEAIRSGVSCCGRRGI